MNTEKIKNWGKGIWTVLNSKIFYVGLIILAFVLYFDQYSKKNDLEREGIKTEQNTKALSDSITTVVKKNGNLESSISGYVATEKELKRLNNDLYNDLSTQEGKVITLSRVKIQLEQDKNDLQKYISNLEKKIGDMEKINDSTYSAPWSLTYRYDSTNYDIFEGNTIVGVMKNPFSLKHIDTELLYRKSQIDLKWGQRVEEVDGVDNLRVFAESSHPAFKASALEGVLIDPNTNKYIKSLIEKKHWFTGFGVGPNLGLGYDIIHSRTTIVLGVAIHYNIYQW